MLNAGVYVLCYASINSLAPGRFELNFRYAPFQLILVIHGCGISCEIALMWLSLDLTDDKSTLVPVMAWCRQATSHFTWSYVDQVLWCHMVSPGLSELNGITLNPTKYAHNVCLVLFVWLGLVHDDFTNIFQGYFIGPELLRWQQPWRIWVNKPRAILYNQNKTIHSKSICIYLRHIVIKI